jgi:polar amino acid transport system substrate-binding protein
LRVGLVEDPPWVVRTAGEPEGAEVELARRFARELGATPEWDWGGEQQHMEALEQFQLDLVVGGITEKTPWNKQVGLTRGYFKEKLLVGFPASFSQPQQIKGMKVAAQRGDAVAALLKEKGAVPDPVDDLRQVNGPIAAPDWFIEGRGFKPVDTELDTKQHVMAVPPGENGWLKRLQEFLHQQGPQVKSLLQEVESRH